MTQGAESLGGELGTHGARDRTETRSMELEPRRDEPPSRQPALTGTQRLVAVGILGAVAVGMYALTGSTEAVLAVLGSLLLVLGIGSQHLP